MPFVIVTTLLPISILALSPDFLFKVLLPTNVTSATRNGKPADCVWLQTAVNWKRTYFITLLILILLYAIHKMTCFIDKIS